MLPHQDWIPLSLLALAAVVGPLAAATHVGTDANLAAVPPSAPEPAPATPATPAEDPRYVLGFTLDSIAGKPVDLSTFKGQVLLIVNVASKCGYTPQYAGLEKIYTDHKAAGLTVLGFPANDFGRQEPGTNEEIAEFCQGRFGVTFPMFAKIAVKGPDAHPLYKKLAAQPAPIGGEPKWNFTKFLIDRQGRVVARFDSAVAPDSAEIRSAVERLLKDQPGG